MPNPVRHLSYSSFDLYMTCGRAWEFRYVKKIKGPLSAALPFGSAFHTACEKYISDNVSNNAPNVTATGRASAEDIFVNAWARKVQEEGKFIDWDKPSEEYTALGRRMLGGELAVTGGGPNRKVRNASVFLSGVVPMVNEGLASKKRLRIEERVSFTVPGVPVPVIGYIDVVTEDGVPCDFKTSSRAWNAAKAHDSLQPTFYVAALAQSGQVVPDGKFRYYIFTKTKNPKAQIIETKRTPGQLFWLLDALRLMWDGVEAGVFLPSGVGSWKCSDRWCEFWDLCRGKV